MLGVPASNRLCYPGLWSKARGCIGLEQLKKGEGIFIADEAGHEAYFDELEKRCQQRLAGQDGNS
jgi:hypothetical protein